MLGQSVRSIVVGFAEPRAPVQPVMNVSESADIHSIERLYMESIEHV
jgi:hypothetical protein